jgi:DNA-binding XRE family transcriptional regulator
VRQHHYPKNTSRNAEKLARFRQQMADFARGQLFTDLREGRHLNQEDAAHEIGVSVKSLRAWEHGGKIRWPNAKRAGAFYKVDPERLVSREVPEASDESAEPGPSPDPFATNGDMPPDLRARLDRIEDSQKLLLAFFGIDSEEPDVVTALDAFAQALRERREPPEAEETSTGS